MEGRTRSDGAALERPGDGEGIALLLRDAGVAGGSLASLNDVSRRLSWDFTHVIGSASPSPAVTTKVSSIPCVLRYASCAAASKGPRTSISARRLESRIASGQSLWGV